jgi:hypothetical protein
MTTGSGNSMDSEQQIQRDYRWNFLVNAVDGAGFWLGMSFFSSTIVLPLFVSHFTNSPLVIGLISFIGWGDSSCRSCSWPMQLKAPPARSSSP